MKDIGLGVIGLGMGAHALISVWNRMRPKAVASQLVLDAPPHPVDQVAGGRVGRQPARDDPSLLGGPPGPPYRRPMVEGSELQSTDLRAQVRSR